jgi:hypothetical protein
MSNKFPWPVAEDELLLDNALAEVLATFEVAGHPVSASLRETAADLIVEAYSHGVRDADAIAVYALGRLRDAGSEL